MRKVKIKNATGVSSVQPLPLLVLTCTSEKESCLDGIFLASCEEPPELLGSAATSAMLRFQWIPVMFDPGGSYLVRIPWLGLCGSWISWVCVSVPKVFHIIPVTDRCF